MFDVEWVRLEELMRGELLVQPRVMPTEGKAGPTLSDGTVIEVDVAWLIGAMVGDGTVTDSGLRLCMYGEKRDRARQIVVNRWGGNPTYGDEYGIVWSRKVLEKAFVDLGMKRLAPDKRVPEAVWIWNIKLQRAFLDGYCDADGHRPTDRTKHGDRTYSSASRELIEDVRALHLMLGDPVSNISTNKRTKPILIKGKEVKHARPLHTFTVWASKSGYGEGRLRNNPDLARWLDEGEFTATPVLGIEPRGEDDAWELRIEGVDNFIVDGLVVATLAGDANERLSD
jgi:hypothetical protein